MAAELNLEKMLSYMRPEGSVHQRKFCRTFIEPRMGKPDKFGNYIKILGDKPKVAFMSHHDTVHRKSGRQTVSLTGGYYFTNQDCLGADCTTGVYIMLRMIEAGIPGVYVIHAGEEIGCVGSSKIVESKPDWFSHVEFAISFDRKGYGSVITHQMGSRTCSDAFAESLIEILNMDYSKDSGGAYTDSNEYKFDIPECTNISVGYFNQHTKSEYQDKIFVEVLIDNLISADWSKLVSKRDPGEYESYRSQFDGYPRLVQESWDDYYKKDFGKSAKTSSKVFALRDMVDVIKENPTAIASLLQDMGYDAYDLIDECYKYAMDKDDEISF